MPGQREVSGHKVQDLCQGISACCEQGTLVCSMLRCCSHHAICRGGAGSLAFPSHCAGLKAAVPSQSRLLQQKLEFVEGRTVGGKDKFQESTTLLRTSNNPTIHPFGQFQSLHVEGKCPSQKVEAIAGCRQEHNLHETMSNFLEVHEGLD